MKQVQYLQGDVLVQKNASYALPEQRVQKGDQLSIAVSSDNPSASAVFNSASSVTRITDPVSVQSAASGVSTVGAVWPGAPATSAPAGAVPVPPAGADPAAGGEAC